MDYFDNPNYCPLFFKGMYAWVDGKQSHVGHCCMSGISPDIGSPDFDHPYLELTRETWNQGLRKECRQCWETEQRGYESSRQQHIVWLKDSGHDPISKELLRLDFSVGSVCNAKCISCNGGSSTTWAAEDYKFGINKHKYSLKPGNDQEQITSIDVGKLEQLYFTGGEPFMSTRPVELLQHIKRNGDIGKLTVQSNTNGSVRPSDELIDLWKQCSTVEIYFSIDAVGRAFEYIRNPLSWKEVKENLEFVKSLSNNIHVKIAPVVGVHNIDSFVDMYQWFVTLNLPEESLCIHRCWGDLDLANASEALKAVWREKFNVENSWAQQLSSMIAWPGISNDARWIKWLNEMDRRRNYHWRDELPGLASSLVQAQKNHTQKQS